MALLLPPAGRTAEIIINEIMANNDSIAPLDNFPEYTPDYVELYNTTPDPINLADGQWTLSNKKFPHPLDNKDFFFFPPGTVIPGDSYLLVFFDDETNFPGIHTTFLAGGTNRETFTLSRTGDRVLLFKNHSDLVDSNIFGIQVPNFSIGRVPNFTGPFTLTVPSPCGGTIPCLSNAAAPFVTPPTGSNEMTLKINEWLALSQSTQSGTNVINRDWFEVYNPDTNIVLLSGLVFADLGTTNSIVSTNSITGLPELRAVPPLSFIAPLGFAQIFCLGSGQGDADDPDEVDFSLSSSNGDGLFIFAPDRSTVIDMVSFGPLATANVSRGRLPDGGDPNPTPLPRLSPEESNFGNIPEIAINEILTHTDSPLEDAIELVNLSPNDQNISHWWLSNNRNTPKKYRIPNGTVIPAGGYKVFYEYQFNNSATAVEPFTLNSARGDECYLFKGDANGRLLGFRRGLDFGPADNGVSFGRYLTSENNVDIVAMSDLSFGTTVRRDDDESFLPIFRTGTGAANPTPRVGPVVINEIMYHHPESLVGGVLTDDQLKEFIELYNISSQSVPLFDPINYGYADGRTNTWRLRDGVSFNFPPNVTLAPGEFALVVKFDPSIPGNVTAFTNANAFPSLAGRVPGQVRLFGPYGGTLANGGDTIELQRPDAPQPPGRVDEGLVPYVVLDRVRYNDEAPWPTNSAMAGPDGGGDSLQRISSYDYGNDVINWMAAEPTPGAFNTPTGVEAPSVVTDPRSLTVRVGRTATFTVSARGGLLQYQWLHHGTNIPGATSATLTRNNVSPEQAGPYQVIITNISGAVTSLIAELTVSSTIDNDRPTVTITYPGTFVLTNKAIDVRGTAGDKVGVNGVFFTINDSVNFLSATGSATFKVWGSLVPPILSPGTNRVKAYSQDHSGNNSLTNERAYFLSVRSPLTLSTTGSGTVSGATNGQLLELGRNIPLTATPSPRHLFSNWVVMTNLTLAHISTSPMLQYLMASNTVVTANFVPNPFYAVVGKFNGLFHETDPTNGVRHGASGFFTLTVTDRGTYTASLLSGGFKLSAAGQIDLEGKATNTLLRKGTNSLVVTWAVDLNGSDTLAGTVADPVAGWTAELNGDRALFNTKTNPCALAGKYTLLLPGLPHDMFVPGGHSYGTVSIDSNGVVSLKGYLADKTSAAQKVPLSKDGQWPLYVSLYSGKGSLLSWVGFSNRLTDDFHGLLNWSKPALPKAKHYPLGFATNEAEVVGARYAAPVGTTNKILQMTGGLLTLNGGNLAADHTNSVTLGLSSKVTNNTPQKLSVTFTLSSGLFKGSFTPTNAGSKAVSFAGAVLQKGTNAAGYYLGTNQSGRVLLEAAP